MAGLAFFHHRLLALGLRQRHAVILIYAATLLAAGLGLLMIVREAIGSLIIFGGVLVLLVALFRFVGGLSVPPDAYPPPSEVQILL